MADYRANAEIVYGAEECQRHCIDFLKELGFPKGVFPLKDLVEFGRVRSTGFVWMKQKVPYEHFFEAIKTHVIYETEMTAYIEKCKMKKITGVKSKSIFGWVPSDEMSMEDEKSSKIYFKTTMGVGMSFPVTAFMTDEEKKKYLEQESE